jgi:predicted ferric reductase
MVDQQTFFRIGLSVFALLCATVILGTIADKLRDSRTVFDTTFKVCAYGLTETEVTAKTSYGDENACNYGIAVGVLGLVSAITVIFLDVVADIRHSESERLSKAITLASVGLSGLMSLLWVAGFIYLTIRRKESNSQSIKFAFAGSVDSAADASIAFCFLAAATWIALTFLAVLRLRPSGSAYSSVG